MQACDARAVGKLRWVLRPRRNQPVIATSCLSAVNGAIPDNFWLNGKQRFRKIRHSINP